MARIIPGKDGNAVWAKLAGVGGNEVVIAQPGKVFSLSIEELPHPTSVSLARSEVTFREGRAPARTERFIEKPSELMELITQVVPKYELPEMKPGRGRILSLVSDISYGLKRLRKHNL